MEEITLPSKIKLEEKGENEAAVIVEPCYPGYGTTLGNTMRRVLLSSLPGAAVSAVKIKGVDHEFSTIENVKEDTVEIIMNLKSLRLAMFTEEPVKLKLISQGAKEVKAADIEVSADVKIANPDLVIATGTHKDAELDMEITVEKGRGYIPTEQKSAKDLEVGTILVDSIFTPVLKVGYEVENIRLGKRTDYDKLVINIKTDGTITPLDAFNEAAKVLVNQFNFLANPEEAIKKAAAEEEEQALVEQQAKEEQTEGAGTPIQELNFSTRTFNALSKAKIRTIDDLAKRAEKDLLALEGLGQTALDEIKRALKKIDLTLPE
ncbi:DNA-directed RNA polymerase subunit alpha [Patescibacteria group bacterium]|nr:DNA-directed RNA polymerase subunit alpha [Patescibacteria group bacterium]